MSHPTEHDQQSNLSSLQHTRQHAREHASFSDLPLEMALHIATFLPPMDLICFSLCNRILYRVLPRTRNEVPKDRTGGTSDNPRIDLLKRLARDIPHLYLCYACMKLHPWTKVSPPGPEFRIPACVKSLGHKSLYQKAPMWLYVRGRPLYKIHFFHVQLALRRLLYGPQYGIPTEAFKFTEVRSEYSSSDWIPDESTGKPSKRKGKRKRKSSKRRFRVTSLFSADVRANSPPLGLYLRTQRIIMLKKKYSANFFKFIYGNDASACQHKTEWFKEDFSALYTRFCNGVAAQSSGTCHICKTSWRTGFQELDDETICYSTTLWIDLCPELQPSRRQWDEREWDDGTSTKRNKEAKGFRANYLGKRPDSRQTFELNSIEACLPGAMSEEEMDGRNMALIQHKIYRSVMTPSNPSNPEVDERDGSKYESWFSRTI